MSCAYALGASGRAILGRAIENGHPEVSIKRVRGVVYIGEHALTPVLATPSLVGCSGAELAVGTSEPPTPGLASRI